MREYNNSETSGFLKEVKHLYKCSDPKRLELIVKYYLSAQNIKSVAKMEYFTLDRYEYIKDKARELATQFGYTFEEVDYHTEYEIQLQRSLKI